MRKKWRNRLARYKVGHSALAWPLLSVSSLSKLHFLALILFAFEDSWYHDGKEIQPSRYHKNYWGFSYRVRSETFIVALEKFGMCTGVRYAEFFQGFIREGWALFSLSQKLNMHGVKKGKYLCVISDVTFPIIVNMKENISMKIDNFGHFWYLWYFGCF